MKILNKIKHLLVIIPIAFFNLTCFDMYNDIWDSTGDNYRLGIFITNSANTYNYLILSDSKLFLTQKAVFTGNSTGFSGTVADFNGDGNLDMLTVAPDHRPMIAFTDGKGNITGYNDFSLLTANDYARKTVTADFNNDGRTDIFIATDSTIANKVYLNNGNGTFINGPVWTHANFNYSDLCSGDFNGDGLPDILLFAGTTGITYIYKGNGDGSFTAGQSFASPYTSAYTAAGDIDNDGDLDFIQDGYPGPVFIYKNNGDATFQVSSFSSFTAASIALGDIDNDGDLDAYIGTDDGVDLSFLINNGDGVFTLQPHADAVPAAITSVKMADLDADGDIDLVTHQAGVLRVYKNEGNLKFKKYIDFPAASITSISIGRFIK